LIGISCGNRTIWAVDLTGRPWMLSRDQQNWAEKNHTPAWLLVDECPLDGCRFQKIVVGPDDGIVWACDDKYNVYVRRDVSEDFLIGTKWELVSGTSGIDLAISRSHVWALCPNGDVLCRFGVSKTNVIGDYWKKVPGSFDQISTTPSNELWGIDRQGQLYQRQTSSFSGSDSLTKAPSYNDILTGGGDWELI